MSLSSTVPTSSDVIQYYDQHAAEYFGKSAKSDMSAIYPRFLKYMPQAGKILDAGCGSGRDTKYFLQQGYDVSAFDASEKLVKLASEFTAIEVKKQRFYELTHFSAFEGIWACASFVHLTEVEFTIALKKLIQACNLKGVIYMSFKTGKFEDSRLFYLRDPELIFSLIAEESFLQVNENWETLDSFGRSETRWLNLVAQVDKP